MPSHGAICIVDEKTQSGELDVKIAEQSIAGT